MTDINAMIIIAGIFLILVTAVVVMNIAARWIDRE